MPHIITITGTNGKGSCAAICEAILTAQGYRTGCFTSPHLYSFNERIRYDGKPASHTEIQAAYQDINQNLGYFAQATEAALKIFSTQNLDAYILEVGIGGRLDPVNLSIDPDVSVITSIDLDHTDRLGNTREEIGFEKAHIFRPHKPAVYGDARLPLSVKHYAEKIKSPLLCYQQDYFFEDYITHWHFYSKHNTYKNLPVPNNLYLQNAAAALQALSYLPLEISHQAIETGLKSVFLAGRFQIITHPLCQIFDVAHNPAAASLLAQRLQALPFHKGKTIAIAGMLKDKDIPGTLAPLIPLVDRWHMTGLDDPRGASGEEMAAFVPYSRAFDTPLLAYQAALNLADPHDRLIIFGSFRTVSALLILQNTGEQTSHTVPDNLKADT